MQKVLQRFDMDNVKAVSVPLAQHFKLSVGMSPKTYGDKVKMLKFPYALVVGCLMYFLVCTRPDIAYAMSVISK